MNLAIKIAHSTHRLTEISRYLPVPALSATYVIKPNAIPSATEKVSGIMIAVTIAGMLSVASSQLMCAMPWALASVCSLG